MPNGRVVARSGEGSEDARRCPRVEWLDDGGVLPFLGVVREMEIRGEPRVPGWDANFSRYCRVSDMIGSDVIDTIEYRFVVDSSSSLIFSEVV